MVLILSFLDSPVVPNPSITNPNASSVLLKFSPPFLWSGYSIDHYNVSVMNNSGHSTHYRINTTFNDPVVSFILVADQPIIQTCNELKLSVTPIGSDQVKLKPFTAVGGYIPSK